MKKKIALFAMLLFILPMQAQERARAADATNAGVVRRSGDVQAVKASTHQSASVTKKTAKKKKHAEAADAHGVYLVTCRDSQGRVKWQDTITNVVTTVGKNYALDAYLAGSGFTVTGPYLGLISSVSYSAVSAADTMTSHGGWTEAGNTNAPTYTAPRKTAAWSAASAGAKSLSAALSYAITGTGTVKGCFLVLGAGAVSTIDNTGGVLYSAGVFSGGDKVVANGDTLNVSYTASL